MMRAVFRLAEAADFKEVTPVLRELLTNLWNGLLNTVINERGNQKLRDAEQRDTPAKECARLKRWEILRRSDLLQQYGVVGIEPSQSAPVPRDLPLNYLFRCTRISDGGLDLKRICKDATWQTWNSQTIKNSHAELTLMEAAFAAKDGAIFSQAWVNLLLPEKQVVVVRKAGSMTEGFVVLSRHAPACMVWPVTYNEKFVYLQVPPTGPSHRKLWRTMTDFRQLYVIPTKAVSPLHCFALRQKHPEAPIACQLQVVGKPQPLIEYLCDRGFAAVPEVALKRLREELGAQAVEANVSEVRMEDTLAAALLLHLRPKMTQGQLEEMMHKRA